MKLGKKLCRTVKKSFSLVLALTIMLSVCAVSGMSLNVFAATSSGQKIYINLTKNKEWEDFSSVTYRFAKDDGTVLSKGTANKNFSGVFETVAPLGATKIELSSGVNFTLPEKTVASGFRRIYLNNSNTYKEAYAYSWINNTECNAEWPGAAMNKTSSDSDYYYVDVNSSYKNVIFSNKGETQTSDLGINDSYSADNALYDASTSQWTNPFIKTIDISGATGDTEFYLSTDGSFKESKYLSVEAPDKQSKATYKTVYVSNDDWKSLTKVYATFDYNDAYEGTVELTKDTKDTRVSGSVVFKGKIPAGALLRFHPNELNLNGASSATSYPTDSEYDGSGYSDNTATYVKTARGEGWTKFSEIDNVNYGAVIENSFKDNPNIVGVDATYFDYWSDMEQANGYLQCQGNGNMYDYWYQFDNFNNYISNIASNHKLDWKYPLYFGNMYKGEEHKKTFTDHAGGLTNINDYDDNYYYAVNNANGMKWGNGNFNQSLQGLMYNTLDSKGNLQVANGVKAPYFDAEALSTATYNDKRVANVYKSSFPFRTTTDDAGVTTYEFTSKNAADNIYFTWDGLTPKKINYGAGKNYGINDDLGSFGGTNGYGIFPFNNTSATSSGKGTNDNLDYGFGIRLDIDFRVPKDGLLADDKPATFNFSGDDDLWVYIGEDSTGADAELALDLGGDHKEASGSINFNTMKATADNVFADYSTPSSTSSSSRTVTVPSDEFWVGTDSAYNDFCLHIWQDTSVGTLNDGAYFVKPYETSDGFYKFKKSQLGNNTEFDFEKYMNTSGKLYFASNLDDLYGNAWTVKKDSCTSYIPGETHAVNLGTVTKTINNGTKLDPNKTYHMVVFYMERGEAESNFSVNFTMTPANNDLKVTKALDTGNVVSEISDDLKANEAFDYTIKENGNDTSGKGYKLTKSDESTSSETLSNSGFTLKDDYMADFDNSFKTGNDMTVDESTDSSNLKYTTNWELVNNRVGSTIKSGSTTNSEFKLVDDKDDSAYAQLQLNYTNKIMTAPLEISKDVVGEDGKTDYETNQQFTFAIALDFDGNGSTYDYKTYPLEYQLKEKGASDYSSTVYRTSKDGSFTIKKGESIKLLNIPVGATYKITEKNVIGYVPYKVGDQTFDRGTFVGTLAETGNTLNFINKVNPTNIAISVNKTLDGQAYSGSKFVYTLTGLESMDTTKPDADGKPIKTNSAKTISTNLKTPDANGKVEFKNLRLVTAGVYRFKITEALAEGENASDYKMDTNTWLAEIELLENGKVTPPTYIKVSSSAIKDKTDAELAGYFNDSTSVKENEALFANETTHGRATVNKKNQSNNNIKGTEFALIKVSEEGILDADDINTIIKNASISSHMISEKTGGDGNVVFDNLTIFKDGNGEFTKSGEDVVWNSSSDNYLKGTSTYQAYCLFEYKPSEGYNPNYTLSYFTLPVEGKYDVTYNYVDGAITMPKASGDGMNGYVVLGLSVAGLAVTMFTGYAIYYGKGRKKRRARCRK